MKKIFLCLSLFGGVYASAQKVVADKIVGIVGDKIILKSDLDQEIDEARRNNLLDAHPDLADPCYQLLNQLTTKALVLQAEKDSLPVSDDEIENDLDLRIRAFIQQFGGKEMLEQVAQRTIYQIKDDFRQAIRENLMASAMRKKVVEDVTVTPTEVKDFYDKIPKDSLPYFESEMEVGQIVITPTSNLDLDQYLRDQLNGYKAEIESGKRTFELLASLYSDDPGSKGRGGSLQLNRGDKNIDPIFLNAAFRLKEGQISPVIKAKDGYDIIQMVSRSGDDATVRYILKAPQVTDAEIDGAKGKLDSIRSRLVAGVFTFGQAVALYSQDDNSKQSGGLLMSPNDGSTFFNYEDMDSSLIQVVKGMKVGQYSQPIVYTDRLKRNVRIVYLKSRTQPHRMNLTDDYNQIAEDALGQKREQIFERWLVKKIPSYYIMIDHDYLTCPRLSAWAMYANPGTKPLASNTVATPAATGKKSGE
jgi:peptidyl-prolyl cis-trans isomerase SurA